MKRLLHEPLVHFLALGALLFAAYAVIHRGETSNPEKILVTRGSIQEIKANFAHTWQRDPTKDELDTLIADYVRDEVNAREAIALGLDKDDPAIRRRLRQKLELFTEAAATSREPTEADLTSYLAAHADTFRSETRFTFKQVFLDPAKRGDKLQHDATSLLASLAQKGAKVDVTSVGDPFLLDAGFTSVTASDVAMRFGDAFSKAIAQLPEGSWQGPVSSSHGQHLIFVERHEGGEVPSLDRARDLVRRDWMRAQQEAAQEESYRALLKRYTVIVEK